MGPRIIRRACALVALLALAGGAAAAELPTIRVGYAVVPANMAPLLAAKPDIAKNAGHTYKLELVHFAGTPQQMAGFAAGEIDLGSFSFSTFAIAVENAGLEDARIVADILQDGAHGANSNELMVLRDGPIKTVEDLRGKVFATIGASGSSDMAMRIMLRKHGLDDKTALNYVEVGFPNMKAMLLGHKADIITAVTPFSKDVELRANARTLFTQADVLGPTELLMMAGRAPFLGANRAAVVDFLEDELSAVRWFTDPANHDEAVAIVARMTKQPAAAFQSWLFTATGDQYRDPQGLPNLAGASASIATAHELGYIKTPLDMTQYADLSMVKEAAGRLKTP